MVAILILVAIETVLLRRYKNRIMELERALGPEKLFSIDELKLPAQMHKEILESLEWLRELRHKIPTMNKETLESLQGELTETHEMYCEAFGKDLIEQVTDDSGSQLKQALLLHIEITIGAVEREIVAKSS
jgi:hypothetical protein